MMKPRRAFLCAVVLFATIAGSTMSLAADVQIDDDRMLLVDGHRTFVVGLYENPDDAHIDAVVESGFNLIQAEAKVSSLDRLKKHGVLGWLNVGSALTLDEKGGEHERELRKLARKFGKHPALATWEVPDEALWNAWYGAWLWRHRDEPKLQQARIEALEDKALSAELERMRDEADEQYLRGEFLEWERTADEIWTRLGEKSPNPGLNVTDSPKRARDLATALRAGYELLTHLDSNHPIWMNHAPRNSIEQLALFNQAADIVGCDIYPVPAKHSRSGHSDLANRMLASVGEYTDRMQEAAPGKPVWMVLQGFGWAAIRDDLNEEEQEIFREPTFDELRFMTYDAIVHGARGVLYWGTFKLDKRAEFWDNLLLLGRELKELQPVLAARDRDPQPTLTVVETWGSLDRPPRLLAKDVDGSTCLIVVNEWWEPLQYAVDGLYDCEGQTFIDADDDRRATVHGGRIELSIGAEKVQVLRLAP